MDKHPKAFVSYSHSDKEFAHHLAKDLIDSGIDIWIDKWEMLPGDSLIQKIFLEGLDKSDFILILLSTNSIQSKWVKEELNADIIKRIEDMTRVIPIRLDSSDIPLPLRSIFWIDMSSNYDDQLREIVKTLHGVSEKPKIGSVPDYVTSLKQSVGGLSEEASTIGSILIKNLEENGREKYYAASDLHSIVSFMTIEEFNDAIEEMEEFQLVKPLKYIGTHPYNFGQLTPSYRLLLRFKDEGLEYNPEEDIKVVAAAIVAKKETRGDGLREATKLSPLRINYAVACLNDHGLIKVINVLGTAPYDFGIIDATRHTREFVKSNCK